MRGLTDDSVTRFDKNEDLALETRNLTELLSIVPAAKNTNRSSTSEWRRLTNDQHMLLLYITQTPWSIDPMTIVVQFHFDPIQPRIQQEHSMTVIRIISNEDIFIITDRYMTWFPSFQWN